MRLIFFILFGFSTVFAQENDFLDRLSVMENNGKTWYNIDGYSITKEDFDKDFNERNLKRIYRKHGIKKLDVKNTINDFDFKNFHVVKTSEFANSLKQIDSYYFVENEEGEISVIWFIRVNNNDFDLEKKMVNAIAHNQIPKDKYVSMKTDSVDFWGRKIALGNNCNWTFLNTLQCPYFGEVNWSIYKNLDQAKIDNDNQLLMTKSQKMGKIISEEEVDILFENVRTKAKKAVFKLNRVTSIFAGGKSLTIYYIAERVRDKNVRAVFSFWDTDEINPATKLSPLLEKFIELK
ncbi:hypothetical protein KRX57_07970 [Weeksellaceae bacterium TAE3-ERU29]|nr:hypothetical protein [Weeksellaceae bacterium TAE3-ERU29]